MFNKHFQILDVGYFILHASTVCREDKAVCAIIRYHSAIELAVFGILLSFYNQDSNYRRVLLLW